MSEPLLKLIEGEMYLAGSVEYVIREDDSLDDVLAHLVEEAGNDPEHLIDLIRLRCERRYEVEVDKKPDWQWPDYRLFDVQPGMANQIARLYWETGWDVLEEAI
ncbi:hypothetical protein KBZ18_14350 [Synechococcus sp. Cruz-9H2]|uniref:hypothetical protein n=1 Tax=unclassified Synechococcus TaxID=2626047 RepID=UPI0020CD0347|nr:MULTISPECIES: hypothetical protein [unclassified Synechococcus]MCP9820665.1 hypothetical protein [Synechococcus sp. Cruz-9H2]MCP9844949.1 hypothetical protein [Synechococcus sp. Edmonson 11F2]MCP9857070.1 hypothetical protein [Synechococcus sp. Cruz-9C9]MCP9864307.1 hypothetical protein [Synechococcus sp. Cruz-7E5]MCP9871575.1 hypothetical protein [Synechococcus sp. Cruz-7B9]